MVREILEKGKKGQPYAWDLQVSKAASFICSFYDGLKGEWGKCITCTSIELVLELHPDEEKQEASIIGKRKNPSLLRQRHLFTRLEGSLVQLPKGIKVEKKILLLHSG